MDICIDFDGTCVTHEFPEIGKDIGAVTVLKELVEAGHKLILFTMRSNTLNPVTPGNHSEIISVPGGNYLNEAVLWFSDHDIKLYGINENPTQKEWTRSPKAYGQLYIDDAALGCPLIFPEEEESRPHVDWVKVRDMLVEREILSENK